MTYEDWLKEVPSEITQDALWRMEVYRLAIFAGDLAWHDTARLVRDRRMVALSNQLFRAVGSIGANIAEGYSRQSGRDQARFYEYALGSAREARGWYYQGRHVLRDEVAIHPIGLLVQLIRLLLVIIPAQRGSRLREEEISYTATSDSPLDDPPMD